MAVIVTSFICPQVSQEKDLKQPPTFNHFLLFPDKKKKSCSMLAARHKSQGESKEENKGERKGLALEMLSFSGRLAGL